MAECPNCISSVSYFVSQGAEFFTLAVGVLATPPTWALHMLQGLPGVQEAWPGTPMPPYVFTPTITPDYPEFGPIEASEPVSDNT